MNMQTDNMGGLLFNYGLDLSKSMDAVFGINRTHAVYSQRDVPGITKAVIPRLISRGVKAISVGVNPGTAPPAVPSPFLWKVSEKDADGIIGFWDKGGYPLNPGPDPAHPGGLATDKCHSMEGLDEVLCFAFRTDNTGPPVDIEEILGYYEILRAEFPGAELVASTFDNFIAAVEPLKDKMPVHTYEIGDTWIQGIVSDPKKTARLRAFERALESCLEAGKCSLKDSRIQRMLRFLIKLPEHTWGAHYFLDNVNWTNQALSRARQGDIYRRTEMSWHEQRQFLDYGMAALGDHPLADMVKQEYQRMEAQSPDLSDYEEVKPNKEVRCADGTRFTVSMDGSLIQLYDPYNKIDWAGPKYPLGELTYDTYVEKDFVDMAKLYNYEAGVGYDKPNVTVNAHPEKRRWDIGVKHIYRRRNDPSCDLWVQAATVDEQTRSKYGAPDSFYIHYEQNKYTPGLDVTVLMIGKVTTRLPESVSIQFSPQHLGQSWLLDKMGVAIDPCHVVLNGSQYNHGVTTGIAYTNPKGQGLFFSTLDTPLVLIGTEGHMTSPFPVPLQPLNCSSITSVAFNIYNNIWNTNYIYYYPYVKEDANFQSRFSIFFPH
ncbi:uncharacterized protein LOC101864074 isoform X2 [Aplysia californica]|nr:uncharacterized protein LOC101864074 isoform X2 [Aplysia californica]